MSILISKALELGNPLGLGFFIAGICLSKNLMNSSTVLPPSNSTYSTYPSIFLNNIIVG